jgi:Cu/Zn superoxide dismutase
MRKHIAALTASVFLAACASYSDGPSATANLQATKGNTVVGTVQFSKSGNKVLVAGEVQGLKPGAVHGFHIHEKGDCSSGDGVSAGGHFNPTTRRMVRTTIANTTRVIYRAWSPTLQERQSSVLKPTPLRLVVVSLT